jgi:hypothetical protein
MVIDISKRYSRFQFYVGNSSRQPPTEMSNSPSRLVFAKPNSDFMLVLPGIIKRYRKRLIYIDDYKPIQLFKPHDSAQHPRPRVCERVRFPIMAFRSARGCHWRQPRRPGRWLSFTLGSVSMSHAAQERACCRAPGDRARRSARVPAGKAAPEAVVGWLYWVETING